MWQDHHTHKREEKTKRRYRKKNPAKVTRSPKSKTTENRRRGSPPGGTQLEDENVAVDVFSLPDTDSGRGSSSSSPHPEDQLEDECSKEVTRVEEPPQVSVDQSSKEDDFFDGPCGDLVIDESFYDESDESEHLAKDCKKGSPGIVQKPIEMPNLFQKLFSDSTRFVPPSETNQNLDSTTKISFVPEREDDYDIPSPTKRKFISRVQDERGRFVVDKLQSIKMRIVQSIERKEELRGRNNIKVFNQN